jgi:hypothetical protein
MEGTGGVCQQREHALLFQALLKSTVTHGEGRPRRFPPNNQPWVVSNQVRVVWTNPGQPTYESQTFPTASRPQEDPLEPKSSRPVWAT